MNKRNISPMLSSNEMIVVYIIVGLCLLIGMINPAFFSASTVIFLMRAVLVTLIFAICQMVVIISGGIDVSFPAIASISLYGAATFAIHAGIENPLVVFVIAGVIGGALGVVNAFLIANMKLPPLIATLGVSSAVNGATLAFMGTSTISNLPTRLVALSQTFLFSYVSPDGIQFNITVLILLPIILSILVFLILKFTMLGRGIYAIGGDIHAARVAGFRVKRIQYLVYIFAGAFAGIGGVTFMTLMRQGNPSVLMGSEMMVIAAVVIGGTRITGGHGSVIGTILGVLLIAIVENNLIMAGVPTHFQLFVVGLIIVIGTCITSIKARRVENSIKI